MERKIEIGENSLFIIENNSRKKIEENSISLYLTCEVIIKEGTTFGRIFHIIIKNRNLFESIFFNSFNGVSLNDLIDDYNSLPTGEYSKYRIGISTEILYAKIKRKNTVHAKHVMSCYEKDEELCSDSIGICSEYMSLSDMKGMEISLMSSIFVYKEYERVDLCVGKSKLVYRLFDVLDCILKSVTINGTPDQRTEKYDSILSAVRKFNDDDHISNDEIHLNILKNELNLAIQNEEYEKASVIQLKIKAVENRLGIAIDKPRT